MGNLDKIQMGIYKIQSYKYPKKYYIGSSSNIKKRINEHKLKLLKGEHDNPKLQNHFNKYSWQDLECSIVEECEREKLIEREQYYIDTLNPWFNICKVAGNCLGKKHSEETKIKLRKARNRRPSPRGWHHTEEQKNKWSKNRKGRKLSKETIEKIIKKATGRKRSEEFKAKMSLSSHFRGQDHSGAKNGFWGKKHTEEARKKMRESHANISVGISAETRQKISTSLAGHITTLEAREKIREKLKGRRSSPSTEFKRGHKYYKPYSKNGGRKK